MNDWVKKSKNNEDNKVNDEIDIITSSSHIMDGDMNNSYE